MIRHAIALLAVVAVSGCSMTPKDLSRYGKVELDGSYLSSLSVSKPNKPSSEKLPMCVATNVKNESVTLSDSSGSFTGAYTGTYYRAGASSQVGGGNVIQYISPDQTKIVAKGATAYSSAMIDRSVRYTLSVEPSSSGGAEYKFTGIQQAQLSTGSAANSGYFNVHTLTGGGSEEVSESLQSIASNIDACLR
ncbi:hypothetical protein ACM9HO_06940 [Pseudomonas sp. KHB2.9]